MFWPCSQAATASSQVCSSGRTLSFHMFHRRATAQIHWPSFSQELIAALYAIVSGIVQRLHCLRMSNASSQRFALSHALILALYMVVSGYILVEEAFCKRVRACHHWPHFSHALMEAL
eukprot:gnl/MRDRNA2_/MRDRNA2_73530_c0_seq3.p1 gnl/MRDRNA2_/MRDRNA2_73530_c0~~gnl/MRDRNA2_/MRDRNA2_73530_c0_seq3.p1  ORF type:complete len:118 (-),score=5.97 gnl/MRDRNA2_/MRDRNA2_73530_c0_seq3:88-441(-)